MSHTWGQSKEFLKSVHIYSSDQLCVDDACILQSQRISCKSQVPKRPLLFSAKKRTIRTSVKSGRSECAGFSDMQDSQNANISVAIYEVGGDSMVVKSLSTIQLLELNRQQRNLLLMRPVFDLESRKMQYASPVDAERRLFEGIDTNYLVLCLLDYLMEAVAVDSGRTSKEVITHVAELAFTMKAELLDEECFRIAEVVLDQIANRSDKHKDFEYDYFDASKKQMRSYRFKLVDYLPDISDIYKFMPTREGYLVYLGMLDLAPEDAAELMEKMLHLLIERGRFIDAIELAKKARTISIEYSQRIRDTILRARRAPSTVNWKSEIAPKLGDARTHIGKRQIEDNRMNESVQKSLYTAMEKDVRQNLIALRTVLQSAGKVRTKLLQDVMVAPEQFLEAQRNLFKIRTASTLPDLENLLLPEVMQLPVSGISSVGEEILSAFMPARIDRIFDLNTAVILLLEKHEVELSPELDDGEILAFEELHTMFTAEERKDATEWLQEKLMGIENTTSEKILKSAIQDGLSPEVCQCIALLIYQSFADESPTRAFDIRLCGNRFTLMFASGGNLTLQRRRNHDYELQS